MLATPADGSHRVGEDGAAEDTIAAHVLEPPLLSTDGNQHVHLDVRQHSSARGSEALGESSSENTLPPQHLTPIVFLTTAQQAHFEHDTAMTPSFGLLLI